MMSTQWTPAQEDAIHARGGPLLVSAAAGSGKTAVLVERILARILDEKAPVDADRLLVVTFTRAAAAEMRARMERRLVQEREKRPESLFLQRQQILLARAHIGTIDSFCSELVRAHFTELGFPADFRVADQSETAVLREQVLGEVLDQYYTEGKPEFFDLLDCFAAGRDDGPLASMVQQLYDFIQSHPFPTRWLREQAAFYHADGPDATPWGKEVRAYAQQALAYCIGVTRTSLGMLQQEPALAEKWVPVLEEELSALESARKALPDATWDGAGAWLLNIAFGRTQTPRGYGDHPLKLAVAANREGVKKIVGELQTLFCCTEAECKADFARLAPLVDTLFQIVQNFSAALQARKRTRHLADFSDLAHGALSLLVRETKSGWKRTDTAREIAAQYDEILVDEYQDTNVLQDLLFRAISCDEENLFMVGDVKQSIYGFRQAEAGLFLRRRAASQDYDRHAPQFPACITLDRNFRSRAGITDAVNFLFGQLMHEEAGGLDYGSHDYLVCGANFPPEKATAVELDLLELTGEDGESMELIDCECGRIAELVLDFLQNGTVTDKGETRPARLGDICILLRSASRWAPEYARRLQEQSIPAWADPGTGFFGTAEVRTALSFLQAIDNPLLDIPLLAVLMSPVYGFSPDDLARLRAVDRESTIYAAVSRAASGGDARCRTFLADLRAYRTLAAALPADAFIEAFYRKSGYADMVLAMENGDARLSNLRLLTAYARRYETSGVGGLSGFLRFADRLRQSGGDFALAASGNEGADVVRIMSIHRSKGLEFPVVILAGCGRRFHTDLGNVRLHPRLGFGAKLRDTETGCRLTTLPREAIALAQHRDEMNEELRVLYVALTRAKERLWMLCAMPRVEQRLASLAAKLEQAPQLPTFVVRGVSCAADWLLLCALRHPDGGPLRDLAGVSQMPVLPAKEPWTVRILRQSAAPAQASAGQAPKREMPVPDAAVLQTLRRYTAFQYPYAALSNVRAKTAASDLASAPFEREYAATSRPAFLEEDALTPAERGTALHAYMQFADYEKAALNPQAELARLQAQAYLTAQQAEAVDLESVRRFFASALAQRIAKSPRVLREYRFGFEMPASQVDPSLPPELGGEPVVVQGAVDCAFFEDNGWVLVDYKTDRTKDPQKLWQRYAAQLALYREALAQCTGLPVRDCVLYAFSMHGVVKAGKLLP